MFNETSYFSDSQAAMRFPIKAFQGACAAYPGTNEVDVGGDNPVCLTPTEAQAYYEAQAAATGSIPGGSLGTVNVKAGGLDWTQIAIYGGIGLLVLAIFAGGRRR